MDWLVVCIVVGYLLLVLTIGIVSSRRIENTSDYLVAGRKLKTGVLTGTLAATAIGGGATLGVVGNAYGKWGMSAVWYVLSIGIAFLLMSILAPRFRGSGAKTVPEYFRMRYGKTAGLLQSVLTLVSMVGLIAAQLKASATVLEVLSGVDYNTALLIVSVVLAIYSMQGGLWGVALTDGIQLILTIVGMTAAIPFALRLAGGWGQAIHLLPTETMSLTAGIGGRYEILAYIILFVTAYTVGEEVAPSFYAAEDAKTARKASLAAGLVILCFSWIPVVLGILMRSAYQANSLTSGVVQALNQDAKYALPALAVSSMPSVVVGILFAGILSATMSSADSALVGAGSVYSNDIYMNFVNPQAKPDKGVAVARLAMVFTMMAAFFTAIYCGNILLLLAASLAIRSVGSFVPYVMGHLWKYSNTVGCVLSILVGTGVFLGLSFRGMTSSGARMIYPALSVSALVFFLSGVVRWLHDWGRK